MDHPNHNRPPPPPPPLRAAAMVSYGPSSQPQPQQPSNTFNYYGRVVQPSQPQQSYYGPSSSSSSSSNSGHHTTTTGDERSLPYYNQEQQQQPQQQQPQQHHHHQQQQWSTWHPPAPPNPWTNTGLPYQQQQHLPPPYYYPFTNQQRLPPPPPPPPPGLSSSQPAAAAAATTSTPTSAAAGTSAITAESPRIPAWMLAAQANPRRRTVRQQQPQQQKGHGNHPLQGREQPQQQQQQQQSLKEPPQQPNELPVVDLIEDTNYDDDDDNADNDSASKQSALLQASAAAAASLDDSLLPSSATTSLTPLGSTTMSPTTQRRVFGSDMLSTGTKPTAHSRIGQREGQQQQQQQIDRHHCRALQREPATAAPVATTLETAALRNRKRRATTELAQQEMRQLREQQQQEQEYQQQQVQTAIQDGSTAMTGNGSGHEDLSRVVTVRLFGDAPDNDNDNEPNNDQQDVNSGMADQAGEPPVEKALSLAARDDEKPAAELGHATLLVQKSGISCKYAVHGECRFGQNCKFSHDFAGVAADKVDRPSSLSSSSIMTSPPSWHKPIASTGASNEQPAATPGSAQLTDDDDLYVFDDVDAGLHPAGKNKSDRTFATVAVGSSSTRSSTELSDVIENEQTVARHHLERLQWLLVDKAGEQLQQEDSNEYQRQVRRALDDFERHNISVSTDDQVDDDGVDTCPPVTSIQFATNDVVVLQDLAQAVIDDKPPHCQKRLRSDFFAARRQIEAVEDSEVPNTMGGKTNSVEPVIAGDSRMTAVKTQANSTAALSRSLDKSPNDVVDASGTSRLAAKDALSKAQASLRDALKQKKMILRARKMSLDRAQLVRSVAKRPIHALLKGANQSLLITNIDTTDEKTRFHVPATLLQTDSGAAIDDKSQELLLKRKRELETKVARALEKRRRLAEVASSNAGTAIAPHDRTMDIGVRTANAMAVVPANIPKTRQELIRRRKELEREATLSQFKNLLTKQRHEYEMQRRNLAETERLLSQVEPELAQKRAQSCALDREVVNLAARRDVLQGKVSEVFAALIGARNRKHELSGGVD